MRALPNLVLVVVPISCSAYLHLNPLPSRAQLRPASALRKKSKYSPSNKEYLERIERTCLQDLMDRAVHAQRGSAGGLASRLLRVLDGFHTKKRERGVEGRFERP